MSRQKANKYLRPCGTRPARVSTLWKLTLSGFVSRMVLQHSAILYKSTSRHESFTYQQHQQHFHLHNYPSNYTRPYAVAVNSRTPQVHANLPAQVCSEIALNRPSFLNYIASRIYSLNKPSSSCRWFDCMVSQQICFFSKFHVNSSPAVLRVSRVLRTYCWFRWVSSLIRRIFGICQTFSLMRASQPVSLQWVGAASWRI